MKPDSTQVRSPIMVAEELAHQLGPTLALHEIVRYAAWEWKEKQEHYTGEDAHAWFEELPGSCYVWADHDYEAVHPVDAMLLGLIDRMEEAFFTLRGAVEKWGPEIADQSAAQDGEVAR